MGSGVTGTTASSGCPVATEAWATYAYMCQQASAAWTRACSVTCVKPASDGSSRWHRAQQGADAASAGLPIDRIRAGKKEPSASNYRELKDHSTSHHLERLAATASPMSPFQPPGTRIPHSSVAFQYLLGRVRGHAVTKPLQPSFIAASKMRAHLWIRGLGMGCFCTACSVQSPGRQSVPYTNRYFTHVGSQTNAEDSRSRWLYVTTMRSCDRLLYSSPGGERNHRYSCDQQ